MIVVDRGPAPPELDGEDSLAGLELAACIRFFEKQQGEQPSFSAYKHKNVRELLRQRFHHKCAYCESHVAHVAPEDVEHYRPKSKVKLGNGEVVDGYWWLAMAWNNLLLSCIKCNRLNKETVVGEVNPRTVGKGNWFPLLEESHRAVDRGDEVAEEPLLVDPCRDDPSEHLRCGNPGKGVEEDVLVALDERGRRSIEIYGLNRGYLVEKRREQMKRLYWDMKDLDRNIDRLDQLAGLEIPDSIIADLEVEILEKLKRLRQALDAERQYLLLSRQIVLPYLAGKGVDV